ncbi:JAB domain-containing protein [Segetibacter koreensis]|uniref:JAB domain-containing protein n=1 Tax=Segetibacter koreensis TaxID=398037 RepID=UPI0012F8B286
MNHLLQHLRHTHPTLAIFHNYPFSNLKQSRQDEELTQNRKHSSKLLDTKLLVATATSA